MYDRFRICKLFINFFKKDAGGEGNVAGKKEKLKG
jgi:hypothetical protein